MLADQIPILVTHELSVGYTLPRRPARVVIDRVNVSLQAGELVCLIGPNGAGKSTLMRTLAGMQKPLSGTIKLMGDEVSQLQPRELAKRLSIVLTERVDIGLLSAYALVALGRYPYTGWIGTLTPEDEAVVRWAIEAVGAAELAGRSLSELSDGERQKILIARALAQEPAVMLLDEPTAFLDLPRRAEMMSLLRSLARETDRAVLLSTHDLDLALRTADRIWLLPKGGSLHTGAPEDLVLSGAFEGAFHSEGMKFDAYSGSFRVNTSPAGIIDVYGEGLPLLWTTRALEREGFCVQQGGSGASLQVKILSHNEATTWHVSRSGTDHDFHSLYDVMTFLRS